MKKSDRQRFYEKAAETDFFYATVYTEELPTLRQGLRRRGYKVTAQKVTKKRSKITVTKA